MWVGLGICLPSVWADCSELGIPRFQLPIPTLLGSWFTAQAISIAPFFLRIEHLAVQDACLHVDVSLHCGAPCHRHFVAQSNLCSFLLSFPSLLSAAWRLLKMWWEWWVYYMHRGMTLLCRIKALVAAEPFPWAAGCHLHPAFRPGICPMVLMWKKTV